MTKTQNDFSKIFTVIPDSKSKIKSSMYRKSGTYAVVDQGKKLIAGYTDTAPTVDESSLPVIVFGDHTRAVKYIDFPFTSGADGIQILKPSALTNPKYGFYLVLHAIGQIPSKGYARHFGELRNMFFQLPSLEKQQGIVEKLDKAFSEIDSIVNNLKLNEEKTNQLLQSMLSAFLNNEKFEKKVVTLDQICENLDSKRIPITREVRKVGKYPYYGASGIIDYVDDFIFEGNALLVSEDGANLLARSTPIAFSVTGKYWVNNHAHVLKFTNQYLQDYVKYFLENTNLVKFVTGAAQPKLTQRALSNVPIEIPVNDFDMKSVTEALSNLNELAFVIAENLVRKRKLADELKGAFLSKYLGQQAA